MFLMFGMQYMLAAGFALREDSHVRVDVIYLHLPDRAKAFIDLITSIFFFIFAIALFWTGWIFAADSIRVWEVSFTEWAIQYWPVKVTLVIGPLLLFLQGFARLIKEVVIITGKKV
jgi:TRAP-type mannitol/chloroaromatic compound transport system permease small subunit